MQSKATTVEQYLAELPPDRRLAISAVRSEILKNLDKDYEEGMQYGMIGYYVPHRVYPAGYRCNPKQPLPFACLGSQKNYMSIHLMTVYGDELQWFEKAWAKTGKKLDMGRCCVRFKKLEDLALDVVAESIRRMPTKKFIAYYESAFKSENSQRSKSEKKTAKPARSTRNAKAPKAARKKPQRAR